ncbi:HNH endonuclease [Taibaiella helva]|uniref:HNH endonuclease n=1 Tax=Taibaiella helva TaxID=2301235 RepID=UPI0037426D32
MKATGRLACEVCGFDFFQTYGPLGADFIECHHTKPLATYKAGEKTKLADLAVVCSNCHRMTDARFIS